MRRFVIGDIHGEYDKLMACLEVVNFSYSDDLLISLGDLVDRGPEPMKCIFELLKIDNRIDIRGNHDEIFMTWLRSGIDYFGGSHGVDITHSKFNDLSKQEKLNVLSFLNNQQNYYIDEYNNLFVHGGIDRKKKIIEQDSNNFYWDRKMINQGLSCKNVDLKFIENFSRVFIGHTPTIGIDNRFTEPLFIGNVIWALDTGACFGNKLTIMNVDTEEYFQC